MDFNNIDWMGVLTTVLQVVLILVVTWLVAMLVKKAITALANKVDALNRRDKSGKTLGDSLGSIGSLIVWLIGLVALLEVFNFTSALAPVQGMVGTVMSYLPRILGAGVVFYIGYMIAKIVRELITTALNAAGFDEKIASWTDGHKERTSVGAPNRNQSHNDANQVGNWDLNAQAQTEHDPYNSNQTQQFSSQNGEYAGSSRMDAQYQQSNRQAQETNASASSVTSILANIAFGIIVALVGVAALEILGIDALTEPARSIIDQIFAAIPTILLALILLGLGVVIAKFVGDIAQSVLAATGIDDAADRAGINLGEKKASGAVGLIVKIAIVLFFAVMAAQALNYPAITNILNEILRLGGQVVFGAIIIAAGFFIANLIKGMIGDELAAKTVYWVTVILFVAMGLKFMGIADSIINMAFGALVIGGALAAALAFGLGGKDAAARLLSKAETKAEQKVDENTNSEF